MLVEEETQKRVEEMVAKRVEEQLAKRKDEIDAEVMKRVEEAKTVMEKQMMEEFEKRRQEHLEEQQMKEVKNYFKIYFKVDCRLKTSASHQVYVTLQTQIPNNFSLDHLKAFFFLFVNFCLFSANTQIVSTDLSNQVIEKKNKTKNSLSFQAFGFNENSVLCQYRLELDI